MARDVSSYDQYLLDMGERRGEKKGEKRGRKKERKKERADRRNRRCNHEIHSEQKKAPFLRNTDTRRPAT